MEQDGTSAKPGHLEVTARRGDLFTPDCPTRQLLDRIGTKWVSMVIKVLADDDPQTVRFAALRKRMPGVSQKMLSQTLQGLVADGLVTRRVENTVPPQVHYGLTDLGRSLEERLAGLRDWAETHMPAIVEYRAGSAGVASG
ncbi:winged helix-turn-helix transcriptional regulator [Nocardia carnea]|uniref:winged helix-turn-helix transcriptional regulator n=1 Tax=Nocardia carnea TaxID=37328 RepID=UPI002458DE26|nr:helix-turn-helix domain-containing protein [Nocardia carnea]